MPLPGTVQSAPAGALGFDADTVITAAVAQQFHAQGYRFAVRYLSLAAQQAAGDLSAGEATAILSAGLALMPVQHVRLAGWQPTAALGAQDGGRAASHALAIGFAPGVNVWCDLEGVAAATVASDVAAYCNAWYRAVAQAGLVPGLYVGASAGLNGQQLYTDLAFQHYWQSCSAVPQVATRGYQMVQTLQPEPVNGIGIDRDMTQADLLGGRVLWQVVVPE